MHSPSENVRVHVPVLVRVEMCIPRKSRRDEATRTPDACLHAGAIHSSGVARGMGDGTTERIDRRSLADPRGCRERGSAAARGMPRSSRPRSTGAVQSSLSLSLFLFLGEER